MWFIDYNRELFCNVNLKKWKICRDKIYSTNANWYYRPEKCLPILIRKPTIHTYLTSGMSFGQEFFTNISQFQTKISLTNIQNEPFLSQCLMIKLLMNFYRLNIVLIILIKVQLCPKFCFISHGSTHLLGINFDWESKIFHPNISPSLKWLGVKNDILDPKWICQNAIKIDQILHQMTHNRYSVEGSKDMEVTTTLFLTFKYR